MSQLNINNLPAEILTEIFRYLNGRKWKNATMACKLWNNLIKSTFQWKLRLEYDNHGKLRSNNKNSILTRNRKFGAIEIDEGYLNMNKQIGQVFKWFGFNVVELCLTECRIDSLIRFAELLNFTPNVKHADVGIEIHDSSVVIPMDKLLPDLKKLKSLVIRGDEYRIIKCFRKAKLSALEISEDWPSEHRSLMVDFLSTQDKLTTLTVDSYSPSSILVEMGKLDVPFRLTHLSITGTTCQKPSQDYENLVRFIKSQAGNLKGIEMKYTIPSSVYGCVFANMTKLNTLWVEINNIPRDNDFYEQLQENCSVHTLKLAEVDFLTLDIQFVEKFLQILPNIRCLILKNPHRLMNKNILVMAQSLSKLESLYIEKIHGSSLDCVKFTNLKTLYIGNLLGKVNWNEFTKAHPLLTDLTIEQTYNANFTSEVIDQITTNVDLQHIRLGFGFVADNRFFKIVGSKCTNLKVLDLVKSCVSQDLGHYLKIDVLRLRESITRPKDFL